MNSRGLSYTFGLNAFSDMSTEEFNSKYLQKSENSKTVAKTTSGYTDVSALFSSGVKGPFDFNWCGLGYCSEVRQQGSCASGYAFAAAKTIEYPNNIVKRNFGSWLSVQQQLDCSTDFGNAGCNGGYPVNSIKYAKIGGLMYDQKYGYVGYKEACKSLPGVFAPEDYYHVSQDLEKFRGTLDKTPFSVSIDASTIKNYKSGVFDGNGCKNFYFNHFLTLVGYGVAASGESYWRLENSWGTSWGQEGFLFLSANNRGDTNVCGILNQGVASLLKI